MSNINTPNTSSTNQPEDIEASNAAPDTEVSGGSDPVTPDSDNTPDSSDNQPDKSHKKKKHLIRPAWLRIPLKILFWVLLVILLIPVLLYVPPVQTFIKDRVCNMVKDKTGMDVSIGKFRLKWPLDVQLDDVLVLEASGDTMVAARNVIADVKLRPLLGLDVQLNKLRLLDGYYRMISPDSSMILGVRAGLLEADDQSSANIRSSEILLNKAILRDGRLDLYMNVWKQQPTPTDSAASTPFLIKAHDLQLDNFRFGLGMLPTIDTLMLQAKSVRLADGVVDLRQNIVRWRIANVSDGEATYLTPDPEWAKAHPAPPSQPSSGPPMRIFGDSIALSGFKALYGVKDARPLPGFDPSYIQVSDVAIGMRDFYNESSTVLLPITRIEATERSGLRILRGDGTVAVDSIGLNLRDLNVTTPFSRLSATADIPFALMEMQPNAPMSAKIAGSLGLPDIEAFMPDVRTYTGKIPHRSPLVADIIADGSLSDINIPRLNLSMNGVISIAASGKAKNPLDIKKLIADIDFNGKLYSPAIVDNFLAPMPFKVPAFSITGKAGARAENYSADFKLLSDVGDIAADGHVGINSERYDVRASLSQVNVAHFMPDLGIGRISGSIDANGQGFNPVSGHAVTTANVHISSIEYARQLYRDISADVAIDPSGMLDIYAVSTNPGLDLTIDGTGYIKPDNYDIDMVASIRDLNLKQLGFSETMNQGSGTFRVSGTASPNRWLYNIRAQLTDVDWNMPDTYIHLPGGMALDLVATPTSTEASIDSHLTRLDFSSQSGLQNLIDRFTKVSNLAMKQIDARNLAVDSLSHMLPPFQLALSASGNGLLNQFLSPSNIGVDTIFGTITHDSLLNANFNLRKLSTASIKLDTITLDLSERRNLLDYALHIGNAPGTLDEFASASLKGYLGQNRVSATVSQHNLQGQTGYRLGLTAAFSDSVASIHFTPLKATIGYMPWTFNNDNFIDYNLFNSHIQANLQASSAESSILLRTNPRESGMDELQAKIDNLHIQDFVNMLLNAPPVAGTLNSDIRIVYEDKLFKGNGTVDLTDLTYEKTRLGNFNLNLKAGYSLSGHTGVLGRLRINDLQALEAYAVLKADSVGMTPDSLGIRLTNFPLRIANPFLGNNLLLDGFLNGNMRLKGSFSKPRLNGFVTFDSVSAKVPMIGSSFLFNSDTVAVKESILTFHDFTIKGANDNPLLLTGIVDATSFSKIGFDLNLSGRNFQAVGNNAKAKSDLYGKLFLDLDASAKGSTERMDVNANVTVLGSTSVTYTIPTEVAQFTAVGEDNVVKFVNFNDTTQTAEADSITPMMNMRINAGLNISPGTRAVVILPSATGGTNATNRVEIQPTAQLKYFQNYMGDMKLNGSITTGEGFVRYSIPVIGEKKFVFDPQSHVVWGGDLMNPNLNISATDEMRANVTSGGNSRLINFLVTLLVRGTLSAPQVSFNLSTNDDLSIQNELQSMSADQRQTQAMNLLLYGQYNMGDTKANANLGGNMLYGFLESQLNQWAANTIKGVDLSFGIDQYDKMTDGSSSTETSYSYQVSKSLFNNRFKIQVGGNYSTDSSADENLEQNLISDIALEYMLRQTPTMSMAVKLFRHTGYESILEGEITETGAGFVMKRKLNNLFHLFRFRKKKRSDTPSAPLLSAPPSTSSTSGKIQEASDSTRNVKSNGVTTKLNDNDSIQK